LSISQKLEMRRGLSLSTAEREWLAELSGGHLGLLQVLLLQILEKGMQPEAKEHPEEVLRRPAIYKECSEIWDALSVEEQHGLMQYEKTGQVESSSTTKLLTLKGLLQTREQTTEVFSPLFRAFLRTSPIPIEMGKAAKRPLKAFLCHSSQDQAFARMLYQKLHSMPGLVPWLDEYDLFPGDDWNYEITKAIEKTDVVIVCLSNNAVTKEGYIQKEIKKVLDLADEKPEGTIFVIPVKVEECEIPRRLSQWHWLNYSDERAFDKLLLSLKKRAQSLGIDIMEKA